MSHQAGGVDDLFGRAEHLFEADVLPTLADYVAIPCLSPAFDTSWATTGHIERAAELLVSWASTRPIAGLSVEVVRLPGLTPVIVAEAPASPGFVGDPSAGATVLYGHLDKQPPLEDWREGLEPFAAVREGDHLYGRGTADDGYSFFAALAAIELAESTGAGHGPCVVLIEASEESGSPHLGPYLDGLESRLGPSGPCLVVCLDSGCLTYDRLWATTSLRGIVTATITVQVLSEAVHSGAAGGVVPSSFRLLRRLLSRIEDEETGRLLLSELSCEVPTARRAEAEQLAAVLGTAAVDRFPTVPGLRLGGGSVVDLILARSWGASLALVGMDGIPPADNAGNVIRPFTRAKIAVRVPPTCDPSIAARRIEEVLTEDPPEGARVAVEALGSPGFDSPEPSAWLSEAIEAASQRFFGNESGTMGEGGTIPFLAELAGRFPEAQFLVTGVLGEGSNAHGPNEMLHLPTVKRVTASVASILGAVP
ncbi:MAG: M20/M25/M40 family metallo-hydrolase [Acidimicrobiales bacterium]